MNLLIFRGEKTMKNMKSMLAVTTLFLLIGSDVLASSINARQSNQENRIAQGIATGSLTFVEAARLTKGQVQLQRMENRAKSDGVVTYKEKVALNRKANKESSKIHRNKHDRQARF